MLPFPSAWEAIAHPVRSAHAYQIAMRQRLSLYARDPVGGLTANFQDARRPGRTSDLAWRRVEQTVADAPVVAAKLADFVIQHAPQLPHPLDGADPGFPGPGAIARGRTPVVDESWIAGFAEDAGLIGEPIIMHHIGGYPIAIPLPKTRHLDAHMPGGYATNPGGIGSPFPFCPAKPDE